MQSNSRNRNQAGMIILVVNLPSIWGRDLANCGSFPGFIKRSVQICWIAELRFDLRPAMRRFQQWHRWFPAIFSGTVLNDRARRVLPPIFARDSPLSDFRGCEPTRPIHHEKMHSPDSDFRHVHFRIMEACIADQRCKTVLQQFQDAGTWLQKHDASNSRPASRQYGTRTNARICDSIFSGTW